MCLSSFHVSSLDHVFPRFIWSRHGVPPRLTGPRCLLLWPHLHQVLALPRLWPRRTLSLSPLQLSQLSLRLPLLLLRRRAYQAAAERCYWARARVRRARCRAAAAPGGDRPRVPAAATAAVAVTTDALCDALWHVIRHVMRHMMRHVMRHAAACYA